jgi:ribosomal protein L40E
MTSSSVYELDEECTVNNPLVSNNDVSQSTSPSNNNGYDTVIKQHAHEQHDNNAYKGPLLTAVFIVLAAIHYLTALHAVNALHSNIANITAHILSTLVLYSHANCVLRTPGFVQHEWSADQNLNLPFSLPLCKVCNTLKPYRAHHCRHCKRCVLRMEVRRKQSASRKSLNRVYSTTASGSTTVLDTTITSSSFSCSATCS